MKSSGLKVALTAGLFVRALVIPQRSCRHQSCILHLFVVNLHCVLEGITTGHQSLTCQSKGLYTVAA